MVAQAVRFDIKCEARPSSMVYCLQAEKLVFQIDDSTSHAHEETVTSSVLLGLPSSELLFEDLCPATDRSDARQLLADRFCSRSSPE